jgi:outer membrane protein OmpA-like peptidoglycan-associated protein
MSGRKEDFMKKVGILVFMMLFAAFVTAAQAETRAGGLPEIAIDKNISDCGACTVTITLNVEFDSDKAIVKDKYRGEIKKVADFMQKYPDTNAVIEGHTDSTNTAAYNQKLSEARANSVRLYLIKNFGIKESRIKAVGYGLTRPIADNKTEAGKQKNRRVAAVLTKVVKK